MLDSTLEWLLANMFYLVLFFLIAVVFFVLYVTGRWMLARRIFSYSYIFLGLIGAVFTVLSLTEGIDMFVPFLFTYVVLIAIGIYVLRWNPKQKISLTN